MSTKYIGYIPTGRTGSTSIRHALKNAGLIDPDFMWDVPSLKGVFITRINRSPSDFFWSRWWEYNSSVEMFTVVRNPYDRLVSGWLHTNKQKWLPRELNLLEYCYLLQAVYTGGVNPGPLPWAGADLEMLVTAAAHGMNFETSIHTAIAAGKAQKNPALVQDWVKYALNKGPGFPVHEWPKINRPDMTVIRFENLEEEFLNLCDRYGWDNVKLERKNGIVDRKPFEAYHTPETIDFVRAYYKYELETFGYE